MNELEVMILDIVSHGIYPLEFPISEAFSVLGLSKTLREREDYVMKQVAEALHRLFDWGLILAILDRDARPSHENLLLNHLIEKSFIPSCEYIKSFFSFRNDMIDWLNRHSDNSGQAIFEEISISYFLTEKGGVLWENNFQPNWNNYHRRCTRRWDYNLPESPDLWRPIWPERDVLWGADRSMLERLLENTRLFHYFKPYNSFPVSNSDEEVWKELRPWHPVYWKTLPVGYGVSIKPVKSEDVEGGFVEITPEFESRLKEAQEWFDAYHI
jgi:hypothetical protein